MTEQQTNIETDYTAPIGQPTPGGAYKKMLPANPMPKEDFGGEVFGSDNIGIQEAADQVAQRREETREERQAKAPLQREYQQYGGEHIGEPSRSNETVSPEQAAHDLTSAREIQQAQEMAAIDEMLRHQIDGERGAQTTEAPSVEQQQPQQEQPQAEQPAEPQPALEGDNVWENPKVIEGITQYTNEVAARFQQVNQQYIGELAGNAGQAAAAIFANYPELQGLQTADQLNGAVAAISRQNPERGQQILNHITTVQQLNAKAQEAQQAQIQAHQQQHRQQFDYYGTQADNAFEKWAQTQDGPERIVEISRHARQLLNNEGLSDAQINHLWQNDGLFRSVAGQKILYMASKYALSQAGARNKVSRPVPIVQRPGSSVERAGDHEYALRDLNQKLNTTHSAKDAAALLTARRARGGR